VATASARWRSALVVETFTPPMVWNYPMKSVFIFRDVTPNLMFLFGRYLDERLERQQSPKAISILSSSDILGATLHTREITLPHPG
jgi:hypothetical protein